jgi:hypothetical protein
MSQSEWNPNQQSVQNQHAAMEAQGLVWQPYAMGGGQWVVPQVVRISDADVERIAVAVVRLIEAKRA